MTADKVGKSRGGEEEDRYKGHESRLGQRRMSVSMYLGEEMMGSGRLCV